MEFIWTIYVTQSWVVRFKCPSNGDSLTQRSYQAYLDMIRSEWRDEAAAKRD